MHMDRPRPLTAALAVTCLATIFLGACSTDEPADIVPDSGVWLYMETDAVSNTCSDEQTLDPLTEFIIDYDEGDSFDIERGMEDITCEIDGVDFSCERLLLASVDLAVFGLDATAHVYVTYEGTLDSETEATGTETVSWVCEGPDCEDAEDLPCDTVTRFTASFQA